jgi:hypothetical protein
MHCVVLVVTDEKPTKAVLQRALDPFGPRLLSDARNEDYIKKWDGWALGGRWSGHLIPYEFNNTVTGGPEVPELEQARLIVITRCGRIISGLRAIRRRLGTTLAAEVDKKMTINRGRQWNLTGDGHGYHVKADSEDFKHS